MSTLTIECADCKWITDIETTSDSNPDSCPECGGELLHVGTGQPVEDYLFCSDDEV